ncbi:MAG: glycosyltransferase family 2 protein [Reyranella sp.]|uniref:glycosyltransferase family 2 protein n=1 Tax=Reyranella sp. TaxID=1929291 RepID=UPI001ACCD8BE|nr:glycosyltransferase family 2 protein [Reyranella sp.]MBN9089613.1 glycosyltransferase family 2 protein [Reyranella sp.]
MISFIVPAFNEEGNILKTVEAILAATTEARLADCEIVVIDDGSSDGTFREIEMAVAAHREVRPLKNPGNLGLGASIRAGIAMASGASFMVVPGDNDVPPALIAFMLRFRDEADVILTAPLNKEQRTVGRNVISMLYQMAYMIVFDVYVSYLNGPGIWPTAAAREAALRSRRFSIIAELNVKLLRMGCTFAEVPGYFQAGPKVRRTVTLRNLSEVIVSFVRLAIDVRIRNRPRFAKRPTRKQIDFVSRLS